VQDQGTTAWADARYWVGHLGHDDQAVRGWL
jgi:hypothetical protein